MPGLAETLEEMGMAGGRSEPGRTTQCTQWTLPRCMASKFGPPCTRFDGNSQLYAKPARSRCNRTRASLIILTDGRGGKVLPPATLRPGRLDVLRFLMLLVASVKLSGKCVGILSLWAAAAASAWAL